MNKASLKFAVAALAAVGFAVFIWILGSSWRPSQREYAANRLYFDVRDLRDGEVRRVDARGVPFLIVRPTNEMLSDLKTLTPFVWDPVTPRSIDGDSSLFIYAAYGSWCVLRHVPKGEQPFPKPDRVWLGGYIDPCRDSNYDYAGRAIRSATYTMNGFNLQTPSLGVPRYRIRDGEVEIRLLKSDVS